MIVGTAGHIDHGKTSLVRALTGTDTDRLPEEKARGISIELGFAYWQRTAASGGAGVIGFVDVPGHERLVHTMLAGATGIDAVLLVIAADDGVMPQTREHLAIVDLLGLSTGVVALTKCDRVDAARLAVVRGEIESVLAGSALADAPIIPVSAVTGVGIPGLTMWLAATAGGFARRSAAGRFRLAVDRCFTRPGLGTVVTGTVLSGRAAVDDRLMVSPAGLAARVRSIHAHGRPAVAAEAGERCALLLAGPDITRDAIGRGDVVLDPALHAPTGRLDVELRVLASEPAAIGQWFPVKLHHAASEVPGRVVVLGDDGIAPGQTAFAQLVLERPLAVATGDRFVVRDTSSRRTIGGGVILDPRPPERRRRTPERLRVLQALAGGGGPSSVLARLLAGPQPIVAIDDFVRDRALPASTIDTLIADLHLEAFASGGQTLAMSQTTWHAMRDEIVAALDHFHTSEPDRRGLGLEQLRAALRTRTSAPLLQAMLARATGLGDIVVDLGTVRRPGHSVGMSEAETELWGQIEPALAAEPYRPPRVRDIARTMALDEAQARRVLRGSALAGATTEIGVDRFFTRAAVMDMARLVRDLAAASEDGHVVTAAFRDRLGNGRRVAVEILEYFDRLGYTIERRGTRRLNPHGPVLDDSGGPS